MTYEVCSTFQSKFVRSSCLVLVGWTLNHKIQSHIDVYLSQATFQEVQRSFPYLVAREFASGGGDVMSFSFLTSVLSQSVPGSFMNRFRSSNGTLLATKFHSRSRIPGST